MLRACFASPGVHHASGVKSARDRIRPNKNATKPLALVAAEILDFSNTAVCALSSRFRTTRPLISFWLAESGDLPGFAALGGDTARLVYTLRVVATLPTAPLGAFAFLGRLYRS